MGLFNRPCLNCGVLSKQSRCPTHTRARQQAQDRANNTPERRAKKRELYGGTYPARRKQLLATALACHICKGPPCPADPFEADHLIPGHPDSPLAAAHRSCNQKRGNKPYTT